MKDNWLEKLLQDKPPPKPKVNPELLGTYFEVTPNTQMKNLVAIQDWIKEQPGLKIKSMPVADILSKAKRYGTCCVTIDILGYVNYSETPHPEFRKISFNVYPKVVSYDIEAAEVTVLGKRYNKAELEKALAALKAK